MTQETEWPFGPLKKNHYQVILADPPWTFKTRSPKGEDRTPQAHYNTMTLQQIKDMPVGDLAAKDAILFMWAVDPLLDKAFEVIDAWGFTYKTVGFHWVKENKKSETPFTGMGYWTRACVEVCLLATKGAPKKQASDVRRLIQSPRREHSRKPDEVHERIERLVPGPYCELFARRSVPGWDVFGDQADKFDVPQTMPQTMPQTVPRTVTPDEVDLFG